MLALFAPAVFAAAPAVAEIPTVTMGPVSGASYASVHVSGEVNTHGFGFYSFEYSTDQVNWTAATNEFDGEPGPIQVQTDIAGLKGGTHYFVRLSATNFQETAFSPAPYPDFTTLPVDPPTVVKANDATAVSYQTAKVSGEIEHPANSNPAFDPECRFEYVTDAQFIANGFQDAGQVFCGVLTATEAVSAELTGLAPGTKYHLRLTGSNAGGSDSLEAANTFTTVPVAAPTVSIDPVTTFTDATATFSGTVVTHAPTPPLSDAAKAAFQANWHFECNPECPGLEGHSVEAETASENVSVPAVGLEPNTAYEVKLVASNAGGSNSAETSFHTTAVGPGVETFAAFALGDGTEALLGGKVNPKNGLTTYWIEYGAGDGGPGATYSSIQPATKDAPVGSAGQFVFVSQRIAGLAPGSTYHYRLVAKNATGTVGGDDVRFDTPLPPVLPADCPNAKLRTETNSAALPECRAYEMTSAPDKSGGDASALLTTSLDGERAAYFSNIGFGGSPANAINSSYLAQREATGWVSHPMSPELQSPNIGLFGGGLQPADFSDDLTKAVQPNVRSTAEEPYTSNVLLTSLGGPTQWVTAPTIPTGAEGGPYTKRYAGRSADASHIFFESKQSFIDGIPPGVSRVWEWVNGEVSLVSISPQGAPIAAVLGTGSDATQNGGSSFGGTLADRTAVSNDGTRAFFTTQENQLYVREDGVKTRQLSLSQRSGHVGDPAPVAFLKAASDGSVVYMSTIEQLTDAPVPPLDPNSPTRNVYSYNLDTGTLTFVASDVMGVSALSADGKHIYFTSTGRLVPGHGITGAPNLYTATDSGDVKFIATLGPDDAQDWGGFGGGIEGNTAATTPDGSHYVFASFYRVTAYDNAEHNEIYLYDVADGALRCVSCRPDGSTPNADASLKASPKQRGGASGALAQVGRPRMLSDDGSQVFFQTKDPLLPQDSNASQDVYAYSDGQPSLISTGTSQYDSEIGDNSPDGKNVFFSTRDSLVGQDADNGAKDVYDARVNGGFPAPVTPSSCEGENCQRRPGSPPGFTSPATTSPSKGNRAGRPKKKAQKGCKQKSKAKKHGAKCGPKGKKHGGKKHQKQASKNGRGN